MKLSKFKKDEIFEKIESNDIFSKIETFLAMFLMKHDLIYIKVGINYYVVNVYYEAK